MLCLKLIITKAEFSGVLPCHVAVSACLLMSTATLWQFVYKSSAERPQWEVDLVGVDPVGVDFTGNWPHGKISGGRWPHGKLIWWDFTLWESISWELISWELWEDTNWNSRRHCQCSIKGVTDMIPCIVSTTKLWKCSSPLRLFSQLSRSACWHVTFWDWPRP